MIYSGDLHIITILITVLIAGSAPEVQLKKRFFYLTLEEKNKSLRTVSSAGRKDVTWSVSEGVLFTLQWLQQHSFNFSNMWNVHIYIFDFLSHPSSPSTRLFMFPLQALNIYIYIHRLNSPEMHVLHDRQNMYFIIYAGLCFTPLSPQFFKRYHHVVATDVVVLCFYQLLHWFHFHPAGTETQLKVCDCLLGGSVGGSVNWLRAHTRCTKQPWSC